jgi:light-regulated signal transduction histidine kinase (bacteriophytochrome)
VDTLQDKGIGIDPQFYEKIFVIFKRLHTRDKYPGTGIGLAVVKRIIERHGGHIRVESKPDEGSNFIFTLSDATDRDHEPEHE